MERPLDQIIRLPNQLGACVKSARLERKMTQKQLASLIGKQQKTISAIEPEAREQSSTRSSA